MRMQNGGGNRRRSRFNKPLVAAGVIVLLAAGLTGSHAQYPNQIDASELSYHPGDVAAFRFEPASSVSQGGKSVSGVGDVNGDGYEDIVIGLPNASDGGAYSGAACLIYGTPIGFAHDGVIKQSELNFDTNGDGRRDGVVMFWTGTNLLTGASVSGAGDVNGDGFDDILIGVPYAGPGDEGRTALVFGSASGIGNAAGKLDLSVAPTTDVNGDLRQDAELILGNYAYGQSGANVSAIGDFDADGFDDIVVGSRLDMTYGAATIVYGAAHPFGIGAAGAGALTIPPAGDVNGDGVTPDARVLVDQSDPFSGTLTVSGAGDVNGDGYDDVIVGSPYAYTYYSSSPGFNGRSYVLFGGPRTATTPVTSDLDNVPCDNDADGKQDGFIIDGFASLAGIKVFGLGDIDGDGFSEVGTSAPNASLSGYGGLMAVVFGSARPLVPGYAASPPYTCPASSYQGHVITSMGPGDFNGDGTAELTILAASSPAQFGASAAPAGDIDGDGLGEILVGETIGYDFLSATSLGNAFLTNGTDVDRGVLLDVPPSVGFNGTSVFIGAEAGSSFGNDVASAGDFNGDGFFDMLVGACYETGGGITRLIYGIPPAPVIPDVTFTSFTRAGNAPERGIEMFGNGQSMMPESHCWLDYPSGNGPGGAGTPSKETVTLYRNLPGTLSGMPGNPVLGWRITTNRTPAGTVAIRLHYPESFLDGVAESSLLLYRANSATGPWAVVASAVFDFSKNKVTFSQSSPPPSPFFVISGTVLDADKDFRANSCELASPGVSDTNIILPDSDGDGLLDGQEAPGACAAFAPTIIATDPRKVDTDGDGWQDRLEMLHRTIFVKGPLVADTVVLVDADGDKLPAMFDPDDTKVDTDGDKYGDLYEHVQGSDPADSTWRPLLGNVNGTGGTDLSDVAALADYNLGLGIPAGLANADLNRSGVIDLADVARMADFNLGLVVIP